MTFDDLTLFITLANTGNFSRTAELLFTSQSSVSTRLKNLEASLECALMIRSTKGVSLTPAGAEFLHYAVRLRGLLEEGLEATRLAGSYTQKTAIGAPSSHWESLLFPALHPYFLQPDSTSYSLQCAHSDLLNQGIQDGTLDVCISCIPLMHPDIITRFLSMSPMVLVAHRDFQLKTAQLTQEGVREFPLIHFNWGESFSHWFTEQYHTQAHFLESQEISILMHLLQEKIAAGFLPMRIAQPYLQSGEFIQIPYDHSDSAPPETSYLVYHKRKESQVAHIIQQIENFLNTPMPQLPLGTV